MGCMVYCVIVNDVRGVRFAVTEFEIASKVQKKEVYIYIYMKKEEQRGRRAGGGGGSERERKRTHVSIGWSKVYVDVVQVTNKRA